MTQFRAIYTRFNEALATRLTQGVATMECAYLFLILAMLGFPGFAATAAQYVQWTSQTLIQLCMLSVIMVGQRLESEHAQQRHAENHARHDAHTQQIAELHAKVEALGAPKPPRARVPKTEA